jgi:hypothetical protein
MYYEVLVLLGLCGPQLFGLVSLVSLRKPQTAG